MTVSGGRFDTVMDNTIANNGAWGILFVPYAQAGKPSLHQTCKGAGVAMSWRRSAASSTPRVTPC